MTDAITPPTVDQLVTELQRLVDSGLAYINPEGVPHLANLAVATRYAQPSMHTAMSVQRLLRTAVGTFDNDKLQTPLAYLLGLADDIDVAASKTERLEAGLQRYPNGERAFRDYRPKEIRRLADAVLQVYNDQLRGARLPEQLRPVNVDAPRALATYLRRESAEAWLARRQELSNQRWQSLIDKRDELQQALGPLPSNLCMFASGSYGREEAMEHSDLDMFLIDDYRGNEPAQPQRATKFEIARAVALIDRVREQHDIQRFSQAGYYQEPQSFHDMLPRIDDGNARELSRSTTALALLIANSKCFWNDELYGRLRKVAFDFYWRDLDVTRRAIPTYLLNDLRRLWSTMLVDFERFYPKTPSNDMFISPPNRKIAALKLTLPQKLGCYTPILAMLERSEPTGLLRADAEEVLSMTTHQRLNLLAGSKYEVIAESARQLSTLYGQYLAVTWCPKIEMQQRVTQPTWPRIQAHFEQANTLLLAMLWTFHERVPSMTRPVLV